MGAQARRLLVIAPHPDDDVLGAGGVMARFARAGGEVTVLTVAAHMPPLYPQSVHERTVAEARRAHAVLGVARSIFLDNPAVLLGKIPVPEFNAAIQRVVDEVRPQVLLIPFPDRHVDHRLVFEAAMVAARPVRAGLEIGMLAAYETLSATHWNAAHIEPTFVPTWSVDITDVLRSKLDALRCFESQIPAKEGPRSLAAVEALALFRGSQSGFSYAEAFHILRLTLAPDQLLV
ncbi:MAG TPA: PIG-L deacetylase family protein [Burkholderiales bacterium]|nr:PIG-L deacetylase family protein [Burkholderiales bacterium]